MAASLKKLSIIIPIYNVQTYLSECLDSLDIILGNNAVQVILVNDGSTDESLAIATSYSKRFKNLMLIDKPNGGLSDARNVGIKYIDSEYVFFLDSDDRVNGSLLMEACSFAESNSLDWVQCGYGFDYGKRIFAYKIKDAIQFVNRRAVMLDLIRDGFVKNFAWGKIYRTNVVRKFCFPKGKYFEDAFWQYKVIHDSHRLGIFPGLVTYYRSRQDSISGSFSLRNLDLLEGLRNRLEFLICNYSDLAPEAAVMLWRVARNFNSVAQTSTNEVRGAYLSELQEIRSEYSSLIEQGFSGLPILFKLANWQQYKETKLLSPIFDFLIRLYNRIKPSPLEEVTGKI